jgi:HPt (histidine-containing phosphotransfer) domain-containing protein
MKNLDNNICINSPCIALTANAISGVKKMYLSEGFDDYLSKPVNPAKLEEMICHYLPQDYIEESPASLATSTDDSDKNSSALEKFKEIEELDLEAAIQNCGSAELFITTLNQYYSSIKSKTSELQQFYDNGDWSNYCIKVHALKSTSRLIGALSISKLAEQLEKYSNNNDVEKIQKKHKTLINKCLRFEKKLTPLLNNNLEQAPQNEISSEELSQKIRQIIECTNDFDIDGLDNLMKELSSVKLPLDFSQKFDKILNCVQNIDFKELKNLLSEWSNL